MKVREALQELADEVKAMIEDRIDLFGYNPRARENTLKGSELEASIKVSPIEEGIELQIANYWLFVSLGWHRTKRFPASMSEWIRNMKDWIDRKHIDIPENMTENEFILRIINKIMIYGIISRPFLVYDKDEDNNYDEPIGTGRLEVMLPDLEKYIDKWFDTLVNAIMEDLDNYFNE